jgi:hypothetical protein
MVIALMEGFLAALQATGVGTVGYDLFAYTMPSTPQDCTAVIPTGGLSEPGDQLRRPTFQVLTRSKVQRRAAQRAETIFAYANNRWNGITGIRGRMYAMTEPGVHFRDENDIPVFTMNFIFITTGKG